jgi:hypothetical protein
MHQPAVMKQRILLVAIIILVFLVTVTAFRPQKDVHQAREVIECPPPDRTTTVFGPQRHFIPLPGWNNHTMQEECLKKI